MRTPAGSEPDFMPRLRRLFADGLPERVARMRGGLEGIVAAAERGAPPGASDLEELFLASHSLKGTAPAFDALDLAHDSGALSELARHWSPAEVPSSEELGRAGELLEKVARGCREAAARLQPADG